MLTINIPGVLIIYCQLTDTVVISISDVHITYESVTASKDEYGTDELQNTFAPTCRVYRDSLCSHSSRCRSTSVATVTTTACACQCGDYARRYSNLAHSIAEDICNIHITYVEHRDFRQ